MKKSFKIQCVRSPASVFGLKISVGLQVLGKVARAGTTLSLFHAKKWFPESKSTWNPDLPPSPQAEAVLQQKAHGEVTDIAA